MRSAPSRRAGGRHQADRPGAEDRHRRARPDLGVERRLVAGGQDVGEEQHLLVGEALRQLQRPDVGEGHAHELGLAAGVAAVQVGVAEQAGAGGGGLLVEDGAAAGRAGLAGGVEGLLAVEAVAAGDGEGDHHAVALLHRVHRRADLLDDAHELVAHDVAGLHARHLAAPEVQARAADRGGRHPQEDVVAVLQDGIGDALDAHVLGAVIDQCLHGCTSRCCAGKLIPRWCRPRARSALRR